MAAVSVALAWPGCSVSDSSEPSRRGAVVDSFVVKCFVRPSISTRGSRRAALQHCSSSEQSVSR